MDPRIDRISQQQSVLKLFITNANYSVVNAIRRTILSKIPVVCFKAFPYKENLCNIISNTSNLNNEIIKHRLICIPIHYLNPDEDDYKNLKIVINKKNNTEDIMYITTEDITIIDKNTNVEMSEADVRKIFPPDEITKFYIDILRLKQALSSNIDGEEFHLEAELAVSTAEEDGAYNVVSLCSYINTPDTIASNDIWIEKEKEMIAKKISKENIEYAKKDFFLLDANRSFIENSFDFSIETVGVYSNEEIFKKACIILIENFNDLKDKLQSDSVIINSPITTIKNCYEVVLENIDHTIGKVLEFILNELYFTQKQLLTYIGFTKKHPHDLYSIIKMAFPEPVEKSVVRDYILSSIEEANRMYSGLLSSMK